VSTEGAENSLAARRTALLDLQSVVAQEVTRSAAMLANFTQVQQRAMGGILTRDSPPLWSVKAWANARGTVWARIGDVVSVRQADMAEYLRDPSSGMTLHAALAVVLAAMFVVARRGVRRSTASGTTEPLGITAFARPYSAGLAVILFWLSSPFSMVPQSLRNLSAVAMLVPVVRLTWLSIDPRLRLPVGALAVLFAVDGMREAVSGALVLEQTDLTAG